MQIDFTTRQLSAFIAGLTPAAIPAETRERAKDLLLDHLGVALSGARLPWARTVATLIEEEGGGARSTLYGGRKVTIRGAALANGTAGHANEFDDTHEESLNHPGCVVMPAALAMAEARGSSGAELLTAIVAGYEAQCRIGAAVGAVLPAHGFHPTAACGVFGAAAAAGWLLSLDADAMEGAFGSAASMSSGLMRFAEDSEHASIKRLHGGLPAERGVLAATLAHKGLLGPRGAIGGARGFTEAFGDGAALERIVARLGEQFELDAVSIKLYACCKQFHALIEAIQQCRAQHAFSADDVVSIEAAGTLAMIDGHMERRPASEMAAQYSLPYTVAATLLLDPQDPDAFAFARHTDAAFLRLADLVEAIADPELQPFFPKRFPARVRIGLRSGASLAATVIDSKSSPGQPIPREAVREKFERLVAPFMPLARRQDVMSLCAGLNSLDDVRQLTSLLGAD